MIGKPSLSALLVWVIALISTQGQELVYLDEPRELWRFTFNAIGEGNGVYLSPSNDKLVAVSRAGILRAYDPAYGSTLWTFNPPFVQGASYRCLGGVTFAQTTTLEYLAYMVIYTVDLDVQTCVRWQSDPCADTMYFSSLTTNPLSWFRFLVDASWPFRWMAEA